MRKRGRGKNRRKGNRNRGRKQQRKKATKEEIEFFDTFKDLNAPIESPFEYYDDFDSSYYHKIISKKWINQYEDYLQGKAPDLPKGDINELLADKEIEEEKKFYWKNRENCNSYTVKKIKFKKDYIPVSDAAWDWLSSKYPSTELIKKFNLENRGFDPAFNSLESVNLIYLDQSLSLHGQIKPKKILFEDYDLWWDIVNEVLKNLGGIKKRKERKHLIESLYYYKLDRRIPLETFLKKALKEETNILEFPGYPLKYDYDNILDADAGDLFYSSTTVFVIRPADEDEEPEWEVAPIEKEFVPGEKGICEYCEGEKTLIYQCKCRTVFYCSVRCRVKDIHYHAKSCIQSKDIEGILMLDSDDQIEKMKTNFSLFKGLFNLGNTCYMAALLQAFKLIQPFREHILSIKNEEIQDMIDKGKPHEINVLPFFVHFMRNSCYTQKKIYYPWLIKAAIGVNNDEFLSFSQSDSQEFFQTMSELIENEMKFWKIENFFTKLMQGRSKQLNQCLECNNITDRPEDWKFLSLPIPETTVYGVMACAFIPYNLKEESANEIFKFKKESDTLNTFAESILKKFGRRGIKQERGEENEKIEENEEKEELIPVPLKKLVFAISDTEKIREIIYDREMLVADLEKIIQKPKYKTCGLVLYELHEPVENLYEDYYPFSIQFIQMSKTINSFMKQQIKTGFVGLRFVKNDSSNREIALSLVDYVAPLLPEDDFKRIKKIFEEDDKEILENEDYKNILRDEVDGENMNILSYFDIFFNKIFTTRILSLDYEDLSFLKEEKYNEIQEELPESRLAVMKYLNLNKSRCMNCRNKGAHKCSILSNPLEPGLKPKFKEVEPEKETEETKEEEVEKIEDEEETKEETEEIKEEEEKPIVMKKSFQPLHTISIFICEGKSQQILGKKSFVNLINKFSNPNILAPHVDIEYCIETYQKPEDLGEDCLVDCDNCGNKTRRQMKFVIDLLPSVLFIQLKRFKTVFRKGKVKRIKNKLFVKFSTQLKLVDNDGNEGLYELISIVNHSGQLNKGHYTAYGRDTSIEENKKQWYCFDDEKVKKIKIKQICTAHAYLLFYKKIEDVDEEIGEEEQEAEMETMEDDVIKEEEEESESEEEDSNDKDN